jgi:putative transposase
MKSSQLKKLKELEDENQKLKRMYADVSLQRDALKDLIEKKL